MKNSSEGGTLSVFQKFSAFFCVILCTTSACAGDNFSVEQLAGERIEAMTESYALIDVKLNEQYQRMVKNPGFVDKKLLIEGERLWIKYRDAGCKDMADEYGPGNIHDLAKLRCLASATSSRLTELIFIETGIVGDQFESALSLIAEASSKGIDQIIAGVGLAKLTPEIEKYLSKSCELTFARFKESREHCYARLIFKDI